MASDIGSIAREGYIYGFPLVDLYRILWGYFANKGGPAYKCPVNTLFNTADVYTPANTTVQTPNSDTPYSFTLLDLRAEPWVVTLPKIEDRRYYSVQCVDLYTYNTDYLGTRATGNVGGDFLIAGSGWNGTPPASVRNVVKADTDMMLLIYRTQLFGPSDLDAVRAIQAQYKIAPLSAYAGTPAPPAAPPLNWIPPVTAEQERSSLEFFNILAWVLQYSPPFPDEVALRDRLASLGIQPGSTFEISGLPEPTQRALRAGMAAGQEQIDATRAKVTTSSDLFGSRSELGDAYLKRAVAAQYGILGNTAAEAVYLGYSTDPTGQPLTGEQAYALRFAPGQLPPVNAFWSLTMYDLPQQLLVANPIDRYLINSPMIPELAKDAEGGYTLYIQATSPRKEQESNWLPSPQGPYFMVLRCYYPKASVLDGTWKLPPLTKLARSVEASRRPESRPTRR
ncbi:MAG TPA: DUF1254 domain-containing protein [Candidatus Cybelea sp.]|jgi:hypothetical protein|nr:DUF1254 domain-containing protein [Candidatus Cybelea sp.]